MADFKAFRKANKWTQAEAGDYFGCGQGFISQIENKTRPIPDAFISKTSADNNVQGKELLTSTIEYNAVFSNPNIIMVPVISKYAYAGYMTGFADEEYIETMPQAPFFLEEDRTAHGEYRGIEVRGDSMDNGTPESILDGDLLVCRVIPRELWGSSKLHMKKWNFVIVTIDGILIKRIIDHNIEQGTITIHSLNEMYKDETIDLRDVMQIMNVVQQTRKPII